MLKVKNYMRNRKDRIEFISDMTYFNDYCYSEALKKFLKDSESFSNETSLMDYANSKFKVIDFALLLAISSNNGNSSLMLEEEQTVEGNLFICDILSALGFGSSLVERNGQLRIKILYKPDVLDFNVLPVLSEYNWYNIILKNHSGHENKEPVTDGETDTEAVTEANNRNSEVQESKNEEVDEDSRRPLISVSYVEET